MEDAVILNDRRQKACSLKFYVASHAFLHALPLCWKYPSYWTVTSRGKPSLRLQEDEQYDRYGTKSATRGT
jgi:hypothetical protein